MLAPPTMNIMLAPLKQNVSPTNNRILALQQQDVSLIDTIMLVTILTTSYNINWSSDERTTWIAKVK